MYLFIAFYFIIYATLCSIAIIKYITRVEWVILKYFKVELIKIKITPTGYVDVIFMKLVFNLQQFHLYRGAVTIE